MRAHHLILVAVLTTGCAKGRGTLFVTVDSLSPVVGIDRFQIVVSNGGQDSLPVDLQLNQRPVTLPPARSFSLAFASDRSGAVIVNIDALDAGGSVLASGSGNGTLQPSEINEVRVVLGGELLDGSVADLVGVDLAGADFAGVDLAGADFAGADLLELPDLATAPPQLVAPTSTSFVSSRRPKLSWKVGVTGTTIVDLCTDRTCATSAGSATLDGSGLAATPDADLAPGVVFWRVRLMKSGVTYTSATWEFWVGARTATGGVDTTWGSVLDVNGDGYADQGVGTPYAVVGSDQNAGRAHVYRGSSTGFSSGSAYHLDGPWGASTQFASAVASAGDMNGDGYADLAVSAPQYGSGVGRVRVFFGGSDGVKLDRFVDLPGPDGSPNYYGRSLSAAGDINGDGYGDLIVGSHFAPPSNSGKAHIYLGGPNGPTPTVANAVISIPGPDGLSASYGFSVAGVGDVNGDGYADVAVGSPSATANFVSQTGRTHVYLGGADGLAPSEDTRVFHIDGIDSSSAFGSLVHTAGDVNGDGYADVLVGAPNATVSAMANIGRAYVFLGSSTGLHPSVINQVTVIDGVNGAGSHFGAGNGTAGDFNGDGYSDIAIGAQWWGAGGVANRGRANIYFGGAAGLEPTVGAKVLNLDGIDTMSNGMANTGAKFGAGLSAVDSQRDGYSELAVGSPESDTASALRAGRVYVFPGESTGLNPSPSPVIDSPDGANKGFGVCN